MASKDDIGVSGPDYRFPIEEGKAREFDRATGGTGSDLTCVPPTFLAVGGRLWGYTFDDPHDTDLARVDIDRSLLLHAEEEFEYPDGPPPIGVQLTARTYVKDVFEREGKRGGAMTFVVSETEYKDPAGRVVGWSRTTVVKTEAAAV
jgi:hypothetical protein